MKTKIMIILMLTILSATISCAKTEYTNKDILGLVKFKNSVQNRKKQVSV